MLRPYHSLRSDIPWSLAETLASPVAEKTQPKFAVRLVPEQLHTPKKLEHFGSSPLTPDGSAELIWQHLSAALPPAACIIIDFLRQL